MAMHLTGRSTATYTRLYVPEDDEYIDVSTLGGGGDTTELETRLSSVETTIPYKAAQSAVGDLRNPVVLKAEPSALTVLTASSINNQANCVIARASGVLRHLETQLPTRLTIDETYKHCSASDKACESAGCACLLRLNHAKRQ